MSGRKARAIRRGQAPPRVPGWRTPEARLRKLHAKITKGERARLRKAKARER